MNTIRFISVLLLAALAAYAAAYSNGHMIVPIAAWIAPALLLRVTRSQPPLLGFIIALAVMTPAWLFQWSDVFRLHGLMIYLSAVTMCAISITPYLVDRLIIRRLPHYAAMFVFPSAMVVMEWAFTLISPFGSWGASAYSQSDFAWLIQSASLGGMWIVSFIIAWFASAVNTAYELRLTPKRALVPLAAFAGVFLIIIGAGAWRLSSARADSNAPVAIALPQFRNNANYNLDYSAQIRAFMFAQTDALAHSGAQLIVWPEDSLAVAAADEEGFLAQARELAQRDHAAIALSYTLRLTPASLRYLNKNVLIDAQGAIAWRYNKAFAVPGYEARNMTEGDAKIASAALPMGTVQGAICFDIDHRAIMRQLDDKAVLLLAPSDDWPAIVDLHARMVRMRAVEYGVPILRPTINGVSIAFDAYGRIAAALSANTSAHTLKIAMPVGSIDAPYAHIGDLFAWLCIAAVLLLGLVSILPKRNAAFTPAPNAPADAAAAQLADNPSP
ncbi:MAG: nitrilase-related carbon-nitrogen hydrolase [Terricaulis sp.]